MGRLRTLQPRVAPAKGRKLATVCADSWRSGKTSSTARGYGYKWQQARRAYLDKHPLCVQCEQKGRVTVATELDHIIPHRGDMEVFWDRDNWQGLCKPCHSAKTQAEE